MTRAIRVLLAALAFAGAPMAVAEPTASTAEDPIRALQRLDQRLFAVGWRLAAANAPHCADTTLSIGASLHDAVAYGRPDHVRAVLGLSGDIAIQAVAPGSPAAMAGLQPDDTLTAIGSRGIAGHWPASDPAWQRSYTLSVEIERQLADGVAELTLARGEGQPFAVSLPGVPVCRTRFEVLDSSDDASADGERVLIGRRFPGLDYAEDEFAAAVAHEMAHNLLGHLERREADGAARGIVRRTEREADRMMPWLLWNAGYDPAAAMRFMARWGPRHGGGLLRKRTHDGWDERVAMIEAEIARLEALIAREGWQAGEADWRRRFAENTGTVAAD